MDEATNLLAQIVSDLYTSVPVSMSVDVTQNAQERLEWYRERSENPGKLVGVTTGFPTLDRATQGFQPGQLITITGLTKASKSTLALLMAMAAQENGETVLYFTYEQTVTEQWRRMDAYRAGINDSKLNSGRLDEDDWTKLKKSVHLTENYPNFIFCQDAMTVSAIAAQIDSIKPTLVVVDGVYLMEDEHGESQGSHQALRNIVYGLHKLAMNKNIAIVGVTQSTPARTRGETLNNDSIMGSRAFGQFSSVVIGLERMDGFISMRRLRILFSRNCAPCEVTLQFDYDTGTFEEIDDDGVDGELEGLMGISERLSSSMEDGEFPIEY